MPRNVRPSSLWAITSYFNPRGFKSRRDNYSTFRSRLGVPLIAVELAHDGVFDIRDDEADILVRIPRGDVMWQKERLLNIALRHLPASCTAVAWIDCDVIFADAGWMDAAMDAVERHVFVQLFDRLEHLRRDERPEHRSDPLPEQLRRGFAAAWARGGLRSDFFLRPETSGNERCNCGMAWAARRDVLERCALYDAMILGMGDKMIAAAAVDRVDDAVASMEMSAAHAAHYRRWAHAIAGEAAGVGHVPGALYHLWHGELQNRRYAERYKGFADHDFDPARDLVRDDAGAWQWATDKPAMHGLVADYFTARHEDGATPRAAVAG